MLNAKHILNPEPIVEAEMSSRRVLVRSSLVDRRSQQTRGETLYLPYSARTVLSLALTRWGPRVPMNLRRDNLRRLFIRGRASAVMTGRQLTPRDFILPGRRRRVFVHTCNDMYDRYPRPCLPHKELLLLSNCTRGYIFYLRCLNGQWLSR